jgi:hypothetical protein
VVGIAGTGKSRLSWEFERHLDALPEPLALHVGRAPSYGDGNTFAPSSRWCGAALDQRGDRAGGRPASVSERSRLVPDDEDELE